MFVDTFIIKVYDLISKNFIPVTEKKILYSIITVACLAIELLVIYHVKKLIAKTKGNTKINVKLLNKIVYIAQFFIICLTTFLTIQIFYNNYYYSILLMMIITVVFGTASLLIGKIMVLFISWYRIKRNIVFFIYSLSLSMIIFNLVMTTIVLNLTISEKPGEIKQFIGGSMDLTAGKYAFLLFIFKISSILSFGSIWLTTVLLMHNSKDLLINGFQNWSILLVPIVYFISSYFAQDIFTIVMYPFLKSDPVNVSII